MFEWKCPFCDFTAGTPGERDKHQPCARLRDHDFQLQWANEQAHSNLAHLLNAIPECPMHGACVPHALEWIGKMRNAEREREQAYTPFAFRKLETALTASDASLEAVAALLDEASVPNAVDPKSLSGAVVERVAWLVRNRDKLKRAVDSISRTMQDN